MKIPFSIQSIQAAFFFGNIDLSDRLKVANTIKNGLSPNLDGTPIIFPFPDDAPLEIPRIILSDKDKNLICNVSANRLDLTYKEVKNKRPPEELKKDFFKIVEKLTKIISTKLLMISNRLGLVIKYEASPAIDGMTLLKKKYLNNTKDVSVEIQIHKLSIEKIREFKVNNWLRLVAEKATKDRGQFLVISDINTLKTVKYQMDSQKAMKFFNNAYSLSIKSILSAIE